MSDLATQARMTAVTLTVNGRPVSATVEPRTHLADFLRDHLLLTGTHTGCEHGVCGACTVMLDGAPARACIALVAGCAGAAVQTIEGLDADPVVTRLRAAFTADHALQCGYCTPGMLITARDIVTRLPGADDDTIRLELAGNLCRCTGYNGIVRAIRRVLDERMDLIRPTLAPVPASRFGFIETAVQPAVVPIPASPGLTQRLRFAVPAGRVWDALQDPTLIAACIPGATLTAASPGQIAGTMQVALGPVRARFAGSATLAYDDAARTGTVEGTGQDGSTRLNAGARFAVTPDGEEACLLVVTVEYGLRGALAQLAKGRVVDLLAAEIAGTFARNLAARLAGRESVAANTMPGGGLLLRAAWAWVRRYLSWPGQRRP